MESPSRGSGLKPSRFPESPNFNMLGQRDVGEEGIEDDRMPAVSE